MIIRVRDRNSIWNHPIVISTGYTWADPLIRRTANDRSAEPSTRRAIDPPSADPERLKLILADGVITSDQPDINHVRTSELVHISAEPGTTSAPASPEIN
jgi:hypothetical protein